MAFDFITPVTKFDRPTCRRVAAVVESAVSAALVDFGLTVKTKGGSFNDGVYTMKLEIALPGGAENAAKLEWDSLCDLYGFVGEDFGRTFVSNGKMYTICGIKSRAQKFPIIAVDREGRRFKFPAGRVAQKLGKTVGISGKVYAA